MKSGRDAAAAPPSSFSSHLSRYKSDRRSGCWVTIMWVFVLLVSLSHFGSAYDVDPEKLEGLARAKVESCGGWQLNRLREVKAFVFQDIPLYHNLVMKHIPGADPELVLLNHYYEELDRIALTDMTRSEINELLGKLGFYKKAQEDDEVPEEFRFSPAKDSPFKNEPTSKPSVSDTENTPEPEAEVQRADL